MENNVISLSEAKKSRKRFTRSLEYELIASLAYQQYAVKDQPAFETLLTIPLTERIPGLVAEYGLRRMHKLIKTMLTEFCYGIALPKSKKLTETRISVVACDLLLAADEDQLGVEDLIVFLELARKGVYGKFKGMITHFALVQMLDQYRQQRYEAFVQLKQKKQEEVRLLGPAERISPEPTAIKQLFEEQGGKIIPFRQIS